MKARMHWMVAASVLCLCLVASGTSYANCGSSQRVSLASSGCLDGDWDNDTSRWGIKSSDFWARNLCSSWGKVVAKIDIKSASDKTWHLTNSNKRTGDANNHVRSIKCCSDLSDLCDKSDVLTVDGCNGQFNKSPAATRCRVHRTTVTGENCNITADCVSDYTNTYGVFRTITASWLSIPETHRCGLSGHLQIGSCD